MSPALKQIMPCVLMIKRVLNITLLVGKMFHAKISRPPFCCNLINYTITRWIRWKVIVFKKKHFKLWTIQKNSGRSWDNWTDSLLVPRNCSMDDREKKFYFLIAIKFFFVCSYWFHIYDSPCSPFVRYIRNQNIYYTETLCTVVETFDFTMTYLEFFSRSTIRYYRPCKVHPTSVNIFTHL